MTEIQPNIDDWGWLTELSYDNSIANSVLIFDPPLNLSNSKSNKKQKLILYDILLRLHELGVKYERGYSGLTTNYSILKYKIQNKFGKIFKVPKFYSHDLVKSGDGHLHTLVISSEKLISDYIIGHRELENPISDNLYQKCVRYNVYDLIYG